MFKFKALVFGLSLSLLSSVAVADVLISDPKQLKNLAVERIDGEEGTKYYLLSIVYTLEDGSVGNADLSCQTKKACEKLKGEISQAVKNGKSVLINFDSERTVAKIVEKQSPEAPKPSNKVVCDDSAVDLVAGQQVGFTVTLKQDISIPANSLQVAVSDSCVASLREPWAQPRNLKARNVSAFLPKKGAKTFDNESLYSCPKNTFDRRDGSTNPCQQELRFHKKIDIKIVETLTVETPLDATIQSIVCSYTRLEKDDPSTKDKIGFWNNSLASGGLAETSIGKAVACTQPLDAYLITEQDDLSDALATIGPKKENRSREFENTGLKRVIDENSYDRGSFDEDKGQSAAIAL
jgi:hypothetical protein